MAMAVILLVGAMGPVRSSVKAQSEFRKKFTTPDGHLYTMDVNSDIAAVMQGACWNAAMSRRLPRGQHQSKCDRNRLLDKSDFIDSDYSQFDLLTLTRKLHEYGELTYV